MSSRRSIVFATDFGPQSEWVGICHAVMLSIAPEAVVIDLAHDLAPFDVASAGQTLRDAMRFVPICAAALVVDPGVGTQRRGVAVRTGRGDVLVGPDNGLLPAAADGLGGVVEARELREPRLRLPSVSKTFHARDVFCPAAAHLCVDAEFADVGPIIDRGALTPAWVPRVAVRQGSVVCAVTNVDRFGNVRLAASPAHLAEAGIEGNPIWVVAAGGEIAAMQASTFGEIEPGRLGIVEDSFGWLSLCLNGGSAAEKLRIAFASVVELRAKVT